MARHFTVFVPIALLESFLEQVGFWAPCIRLIDGTASDSGADSAPAIAIAGSFVFGFWPGLLLNITGLFIGSMIAFVFARIFGKPLVDRMLGPRYSEWLERINTPRGWLVVALAFLIPFLPDDALCYLAALTTMHIRLFAVLVLFCRTPGIVFATLTGAGLFNLPWYGWAALMLLVAIICYFMWRRKDELEQWALDLLETLLQARASKSDPNHSTPRP